MRLKIPGESHRSTKGPVYAPACIWPRVIKPLPGNGRKGGLATAHTSLGQHRQDIAEVVAYLESNPKATIGDVEMCCNMGRHQAIIAIREVRNGSGREGI